MANAVITVLEADGVTTTDVTVLDVARQAAAASKSVAMATEDKAVLDAMAASLVTIDGRVDGLETLIGTTNTTLSTIDSRVDGLETLVTSTNTKLDTLNTTITTATVDTGTPGSPATTEVMTVQGAAFMTPMSANLLPTTSGGLTVSSTLIASGTNATPVKASAGQLYKIEVTNNSANIGYLKIYNTAGTPTAGSGTPVIRLMCPGSSTGTGAFSTHDNGVAFATGIGFTFTGGIADADTTSVAASAFIVNLYYK